VAPDLALTAIQVSSPDTACGTLSDTIQISVEVRNQGDLRVGPGVIISFDGSWENPALDEALEDENGDPLTFALETSLEPGASTIITVEYEAGRNGRDDLPTTVTASIDPDDMARECDEDNNTISGPVEGGAEVADLSVVVNSASNCGSPKVKVTVYNEGSADASDILVRIYAGDPSSGGDLLGETIIAGPLAPGANEQVTVTLDDELMLTVTIWAVVDPLNTIVECNDGNNTDKGPDLVCDQQPH
jgi:subtilase family serine protease